MISSTNFLREEASKRKKDSILEMNRLIIERINISNNIRSLEKGTLKLDGLQIKTKTIYVLCAYCMSVCVYICLGLYIISYITSWVTERRYRETTLSGICLCYPLRKTCYSHSLTNLDCLAVKSTIGARIISTRVRT